MPYVIVRGRIRGCVTEGRFLLGLFRDPIFRLDRFLRQGAGFGSLIFRISIFSNFFGVSFCFILVPKVDVGGVPFHF